MIPGRAAHAMPSSAVDLRCPISGRRGAQPACLRKVVDVHVCGAPTPPPPTRVLPVCQSSRQACGRRCVKAADRPSVPLPSLSVLRRAVSSCPRRCVAPLSTPPPPPPSAPTDAVKAGFVRAAPESSRQRRHHPFLSLSTDLL